MKKTISRLINKLIPLSLIAIILISAQTGLKAEMSHLGCASSVRVDENNQLVSNCNVCNPQDSYTNNTTPNYNTASNDNNVNLNINSQTIPNTNLSTGFINPLTGLSTLNDVSRNRPMAVSISNQRGALPTNAINGISQADIVYELLVEAGITRFIALYQDFSDVGVVGSIRSARHYTVELAEAYDAIFIHAGGSPLGYEEIEKRNITNLDEVSGKRAQAFRRDPNRIPGQTVQNYHSAVTSGSSVMQWLPTYGIRLTHFDNFKQFLSFTNNPIPSGNRAHNAVVRFSSGKDSTFTYNEAQNLYYMNQFGSQLTDANNNNPVCFTNLLVLEMPITDLVGRGEGSGRQDMTSVGYGNGYFVSAGRYIEIFWFRIDKSAQFIYTDVYGNELELGRGKTYVGIIPPERTVSFS